VTYFLSTCSVLPPYTQYFDVKQGVRQGCPLAPYLFLIVGEILNHCIKQEASRGRIQGIQLLNSEASQIIMQFADDTSMTIRGEEAAVRNMVSTLQFFYSGSGLSLNVEKSTTYWWEPGGHARPLWTESLGFQWASNQDISKLLGTPFGLSISATDVDCFLSERMDKKLRYWSGRKLNLTGRTIIGNSVLISTTLYFLAIWGGSSSRVKRITAKVRNYICTGEDKPFRARVAWQTCCHKKRDGGLGLVDPAAALTALMAKWILAACEPGDSNFKIMLRHRISNFQPYPGGNWPPSLQWFALPSHAAKSGSMVWQRTAQAWK
jgi:hypothetical protein